jgi:CDP-diacylglycerol---serine O-phosphatidyltransferase
LGMVGVIAAFTFAACGALRLARFNVLAIRSPHGGASRFFVGMPIPFAAAGVISMIIAFQNARGGELPDDFRWPVLVVTVFLALLMVSTVRYRTFKDVRPSVRSAVIALVVIAIGVLVATQIHPAWVLVAYFGLYLGSGLIESALMLRRHFAERKQASLADVVDEDEDEDDAAEVDEQEVL